MLRLLVPADRGRRWLTGLVRLVQVVSVTVRLMPLVRAVWLSCQASVALVTVMVVRWGLVPVVAL